MLYKLVAFWILVYWVFKVEFLCSNSWLLIIFRDSVDVILQVAKCLKLLMSVSSKVIPKFDKLTKLKIVKVSVLVNYIWFSHSFIFSYINTDRAFVLSYLSPGLLVYDIQMKNLLMIQARIFPTEMEVRWRQQRVYLLTSSSQIGSSPLRISVIIKCCNLKDHKEFMMPSFYCRPILLFRFFINTI